MAVLEVHNLDTNNETGRDAVISAVVALAEGLTHSEFVSAVAKAVGVALRGVEVEAFDSRNSLSTLKSYDLLMRVGSAGKTMFAGRAERCNIASGSSVPADKFLAFETGEKLADTRERLATARLMQDLPAARDALLSGRLSDPQAAAVARGAVDPDAEQQLLQTATNQPLRELQLQSRRLETSSGSADDQQSRLQRAHKTRFAKFEIDEFDSSMFRGFIKGPVSDLAYVKARLRPLQDKAYLESQRRLKEGGPRESLGHNTYDAFIGFVNGKPPTPSANQRNRPSPKQQPSSQGANAAQSRSTCVEPETQKQAVVGDESDKPEWLPEEALTNRNPRDAFVPHNPKVKPGEFERRKPDEPP